MNQAAQTLTKSPTSPTKGPTDTAGKSGTNVQLKTADSYATQVQMLAPTDTQNDGPSGDNGGAPGMNLTDVMASARISGPNSSVLTAGLGEPPWQIKSTKEGRTLDTMKIVNYEKRTDGNAPDWYRDHNDPRNIGHKESSKAMVWGGWVAGLDGRAGIQYCGYVDNETGVGHYFLVDYIAPTEKTRTERTHDQLRSEGGGMTLQYGLYRGQQFMSGVVNFFNPADNIIQGVTGRNLNVFDDDFGKELSKTDRALQFVQAAAEAYGAKSIGALSGAEKIALGIACVADAGTEAVVGSLVDMKLIDSQGAALLRVVGKLAGLSNQFVKYRGGQQLELLDYLGSLAALSGAGEQAIKGMMGQKGFDEFWKPNAGTVASFITNADKLGGATAGLLELASKFKR